MTLPFPTPLPPNDSVPRRHRILLLSAAIAGCLATPLVHAQSSSAPSAQVAVEPEEEETGDEVIATAPLEVAGTAVGIAAPGNAGSVGHDQVANMANFSGSVEDTLRLLPQVQFDTAAQRSLQMGEIKPPLVAISGGRPYENSYVIDGLGNNNYVTPVTLVNNGNPEQPILVRTRSQLVPPNASPQGYNLNIDLIDNVEVLDSRVPVKYSGFTGGVVAAETRKPDPSGVAGRIYWRRATDSWARIHYDPAMLRGAEFDESFDEARQPHFTRNSYGFNVNLPIDDRFAAIVSVDTNQTRIPLLYRQGAYAEVEPKDQFRDSRTIFASVGGRFGNGLDATVTAVRYDYTGNYFEPSAINSEHDEVQETSDLSLKLSQDVGFGTWNLKARYADMASRRDVQSHYYRPWRTYGETNWGGDSGAQPAWINIPTHQLYGFMQAPGFSPDGNLNSNDLDFGQRTSTFAFDIAFNALQWGRASHTFSVGVNAEQVKGSLDGGEGIVYNGTFVALNGPLAPGQEGVSYNWQRTNGQVYDQYFYTKDVTDPFSTRADTSTYSLWLQDDIDIGKLALQPGLRLDYDDQFGNHNLAPRLAANWKATDDFALKAGVARYYGGPSLYYALYHQMGFTRYTRPGANGVAADGTLAWRQNSVSYGYDYDARDLKTPYSDEASIGFNYRAPADFDIDYNYVWREGKDGITRREVRNDDGRTETLADNAGRTNYQGHTLTVSNHHFANHYFRLAANWSRTRSNYADYYTASGLITDVALRRDRSRVIYNGEMMPADELDLGNYNTPLKLVGFYQTRLFDRLDLTTTLGWASRTPTLVFLAWTPTDDGLNVAAYEEYELASQFTMDMSLGWDVFTIDGQALRLTVDAYNLLDARNVIGRGSYTEFVQGQGNVRRYFDYYAPGRSFQARVEYRF